MSLRRFGPVTIPHKFKGWKETLQLPDIIIEVDEAGLTITPVDDLGRRQAALAFTVKEG